MCYASDILYRAACSLTITHENHKAKHKGCLSCKKVQRGDYGAEGL